MAEISKEIFVADYKLNLPAGETNGASLRPVSVMPGYEMAVEAGARLDQTDLTRGEEQLPLQAEFAALRRRVGELEEVADRLREQDRAKAGFISMVVHDIRSPLTVIMGTLDLLNEDLLDGRPLDYQHYQYLFRESLHNCQEIDRLIEDMLELSRLRESRLRLNFEPTTCLDLIESALAVAAGAARQAGITLGSELQPLLPLVFVDRKQMHRALMNLVNNAIKFTPRGGQVTLRARILEERRSDAPCDYVLLSVSDTGEGLSPEESPYIFDAYWQAPNGRRKTGTGLGLAIVKRIAVGHGGNASVRSIPGKGSTFTIMVPIRDTAPEQMIEPAD